MKHVSIWLALVFSSGCSQSPSPTAPSHTALPSAGGAAQVSGAHLDPMVAAADTPSTPTNLTATVSGNTVALNWGASTSGIAVIGYRIEAGNSPQFANLVSFNTGSSATSLTVGGVAAGTYYVRVRAVNAAAEVSMPSNVVSVSVGPTGGCDAPPDPPTDLASTMNGTVLTLSWRAPAAGCATESYIIEAGTTVDGVDLAAFDTGSTNTAFVIDLGNAVSAALMFGGTGVTTPPTFYVRIKGRNRRGASRASNTAQVSRSPQPAPPPGNPRIQPEEARTGVVLSECTGGVVRQSFNITAMAGQAWETNTGVGGLTFDPPTGTGPSTVVATYTLRALTNAPRPTDRCSEQDPSDATLSFLVFFRAPAPDTKRATILLKQRAGVWVP